jgi:hypothetical protein
VTLQEFSQIFALLAVQLGDTQADEIKIRAFHKALEDLDVELVAMAAQRLGRSALNADGEAWMPKAPEWRAMVGKVEQERIAVQRDVIRKRRIAGEPPLCAACDDTGFTENEAHRFRRCDCRDLRRLEILGRRPMPALPETGPIVNNEPKLLHAVKDAVKGF